MFYMPMDGDRLNRYKLVQHGHARATELITKTKQDTTDAKNGLYDRWEKGYRRAPDIYTHTAFFEGFKQLN